jgi:cytochrome c biogenesis protein CcmG/thiol:disulfide interchange protein DsbE
MTELEDKNTREVSDSPGSEETKGINILGHKISVGALLAWLGLLFLLGIIGVSLMRSQQGPVAIGSPAPDFTLTTFEGDEITLSELRGKVVLINFWASWCKPCEREADDLETAWRYYEPRGDVVFLGIDWTDTEPKAMVYLDKFDITFPNGPDLGTRISQAFRTTGVPETYVVDKNGILAYVKLSPFLSVQEIINAIDPLLE